MCRKFGEENKSFVILTMKRRKKMEKAAQRQGDSTSLFIPCTIFQSKIIKWCLKGELQIKKCKQFVLKHES